MNLDFDASIRAFQNLGLNKELLDRDHVYADPVFYKLEVGEVSPAEFRQRVREILNNPLLTDEQIDAAWCAMILDIPAKRVKKLQALRKNYRLFLFSNTNEIHITQLHKEFRNEHGIEFSSLFEKDYYSHEIHARKPDTESFLEVIELAGIVPEETLFVDDLEKNIEAAEKAGLKTFWLQQGMEMADLF